MFIFGESVKVYFAKKGRAYFGTASPIIIKIL